MKWKVAEPIDGGIPAVYPDTGKMEFPIAVKPDFIRADVWAEHARLIAAAQVMCEALERAKVLIGARNDTLSEAARQSNINEAWHIIDAALNAARSSDTLSVGGKANG